MTVRRALATLFLVAGAVLGGFPPDLRAEKPLDIERLLAPDHIIEVRLEIPEKDWDKLRKQARDFATAFSNPNVEPFTYVKGDITIDGVRIESVGVRKKGLFGSLDEDAPSLKIKFSEFKDLDPVRGTSRLTLNNNKQDLALVSQRLASIVFQKAGVHAPRVNFARVYVNGADLGVYSHVESVDKPFLERRFHEKSGDLYEGTLADFFPKTIEKLELKTNESSSRREHASQLAELLAAPGDMDLDELGRRVDLDNFFRFWAVESLIGWWDGYSNNQNNFFAYSHAKTGKLYFMPWGVDAAFMGTTGPFGMFGGSEFSTAVYAQGILTNRLYRAPGMADRYREAMLKVLDEAWNEDELLAEIDRVEKMFGESLPERHADRAESMNDTREFIKGRRAAVLEAFKTWPGKVPDEPRKPMYTVDVGSAKGSFQTTWREQPMEDKGDNASEKNALPGSATVTIQLDGQPLVVEQISVVAQPFRWPGFGGGGGGGRGGRRGFRGPMMQPPATIVISGTRADDQKPVTLTLMVPRDRLAEVPTEPLTVGGSLAIGPQGPAFFGGPGMKSITGTLALTRSGVETGSELEGTFDLKLIEIHGGMFGQRPRAR